jgi:hypothetical protein
MIINNERPIIIKKFYHSKFIMEIFITGMIKNFLKNITIHLDKYLNKLILKTNVKQKCNKTLFKILWMVVVYSVWQKAILRNINLKRKIMSRLKLHIFLKLLQKEKIISSQQNLLKQILMSLIITKIIIKTISVK